MEQQKREELKRYLRHGDQKKIAEIAQVSRKTIHNWLKGKVKTTSAEALIVEFAMARKKQVEVLVQQTIG